MKILPQPGFIHIKPDEFDKKTDSGLLVDGDENEQKEPMSATVLAVGKKVKNLSRGDRIFYALSQRREIMTDTTSEKFFFVKAEDVVALLK